VQRRFVPGRYYLSLGARVFGRIGKNLLVEVEPAWPIGDFTWVSTQAHGTEHFETIPTGYTPTERFVPMFYATAGDVVELLYRRRDLCRPALYRDASRRSPQPSDVVIAPQRAASQANTRTH
jgi:hypothetical protein